MVAAVLIAALAQELVWFALSRWLVFSNGYDFYRIAPFSLLNGALYVVLTLLVCLMCIPLAGMIRPFKKFALPPVLRRSWLVLAVSVNIIAAAYLRGNARYVSGALTGIDGVLYMASNGLSISVMCYLLRYRYEKNRLPKLSYLALFILSLLPGIDGLSKALSLFVFLMLLAGRYSVSRGFIVAVTAVGLLAMGLTAKFSGLATISDKIVLIHWVLARLSIHAENAYMYLSGMSSVHGLGEYLGLVQRSLDARLALIMGQHPMIEFPRNVSEAMFYDIRGEYYGGSSPGLLTTVLITGPLAPVALMFYAFLLMQFFGRTAVKISKFRILFFSIFFRFVFDDLSDILTIISPGFIFMIMMLFGSMVRLPAEARPKNGAVGEPVV